MISENMGLWHLERDLLKIKRWLGGIGCFQGNAMMPPSSLEIV
jgi:hypothetical protein